MWLWKYISKQQLNPDRLDPVQQELSCSVSTLTALLRHGAPSCRTASLTSAVCVREGVWQGVSSLQCVCKLPNVWQRSGKSGAGGWQRMRGKTLGWILKGKPGEETKVWFYFSLQPLIGLQLRRGWKGLKDSCCCLIGDVAQRLLYNLQSGFWKGWRTLIPAITPHLLCLESSLEGCACWPIMSHSTPEM